MEVGHLLLSSIMSAPATTYVIYKGLPTMCYHLLGARSLPPLPLPWLDPELQDLLARCLYVDLTKRPDLRTTPSTATNAVRNNRPAWFPNSAKETDNAIRAFMQEFVFNAST